ncbi:MAG: GNAT family N-acetyltransferase [Clostridiales bacterium]|nr:GNAT family N-acetyltransferase [Clostridiales bacterium]
MENVYEKCPELGNDRWLLRLVTEDDSTDLMEVYGDKNAVPFFNSDNCHGDNFYYPTKEKMDQAIDFWLYSYGEKYFVRFAVIDKAAGKAVGTIEAFHRPYREDFGEVGVIRLDLGSAYETADVIKDILSVIIPPSFGLFDCNEIISKCPIYAVERSKAFLDFGFTPDGRCLVGDDGYAYNGYWIIKKTE